MSLPQVNPGQLAPTISDFIKRKIGHQLRTNCPNCFEGSVENKLFKITEFVRIPDTTTFHILSNEAILAYSFSLPTIRGKVNYRLRGIVYYGNYHFTSRIISENGTVWYHDGQTTASRCTREGSLIDADIDLHSCKGKAMKLVIYARK